jgi:hypothetical protein
MRFFHSVLRNCRRESRAGAGLRTCECLIGHSAKRERDSAKPSNYDRAHFVDSRKSARS